MRRIAPALFGAWVALMIGGTVYEGVTCGWNRGLWEDTACKSPEKDRARFNRAVGWMQARAFDEALLEFADLAEYAESAEMRQLAQSHIALVFKYQGRPDAAQQVFEVLLADDPTHAVALNGLAGLYAESRPTEALLLLDSLITQYPDYRINASVNYNRAVALKHAGDCATAFGAFRMAQRLDPSLVEFQCP